MIPFLLTTLLAPLASATIIALFFRKSPRTAQTISVATCAIYAAATLLIVFAGPILGEPRQAAVLASLDWLTLGDFTLRLGIHFNDLAALMLAIVAIVGLCVHIFSIGYMRDDTARPRYFAGLSIFMFSMTGIVLADNLYMMFIFWELVGFSSWLLINHDYHRQAAADASKKAFIVNRVGDFGFLLGIIATQYFFNTTNLAEISQLKPLGAATLPALIPLLLFCGTLGKSAQFPLHVWLPDAMEGPTPVSALIHAATMVAAGIYMLCRLEPLFAASQTALNIILAIGLITALYAALCAITQRDIKKILAYSTLSQLGYMTAAFGLGELSVEFNCGFGMSNPALPPPPTPTPYLLTMVFGSGAAAAMFHLTTHAFFKALLFLGSGSVIAGNHHEQDIFKMGGLWRKMPLTFVTFTIGTAAIIGLPFLSGFYSKDAILYLALSNNTPAFIILALTAILTAFYMIRLWRIAFLGQPRSETAQHSHESGPSMILPLLLLALLAITAGYTAIYQNAFDSIFSQIPIAHGAAHTIILATSVAVLLIGATAALIIYRKLPAQNTPPKTTPVIRFLTILQQLPDQLYAAYIQKIQQPLARLTDRIDQLFIAGLIIRGAAGITGLIGIGARALHTGKLQTYLYWFLFGAAALIAYAML